MSAVVTGESPRDYRDPAAREPTVEDWTGRFEIVEELGALDPDLPAGNDREHWRFVPVLRML